VKRELEEKLKADFPDLYYDLFGRPAMTCLTNIQTGDGWFELIYDLSKKLEDVVAAMPDDVRCRYRAAQCKEKFGTLRFYMSNYNKEITELISGAEQRSCYICESCGKTAKLGQTGHLMHVLCDVCLVLK
jgi:hypothetical protein